ncbi:TIGR02680 family protein [Speluncibacter jeojiensis]|uniref:TIGR02680 family protein n=1 Tax=Speluncibacter jeojiensis TaxID=2710754 RepID=A0A9X4M1U9_9ACTN|nr:TIGR02680 family protein [Corynebacteriales bacterium D3-21]
MVTQPATDAKRFKPTRAGIVNLWDYRDEEFSFADGRLVLRGPNGSGKTKGLEVLFPFVLDGRIEPRRLNPFAGEERTMKSNLLYRGQDSEHAYVWMEFCRATRDDPEAVTVGIGMRAAKHTDRVARWYFVAEGRVGVDFSLLAPDDRPMTKKQLAEQIGADAIVERPADYRAAIDARLFGLGAERYEQLINLILTLRRPQLAKNLDPKGLSRALTDGLRPLDDDLLVEAARSFSDMEQVSRTLERVGRADRATQAFLADYVRYVQVLARDAADGLGRRLDQVRTSASAVEQSTATQVAAYAERSRAETEAEEAERRLEKWRTELEVLKGSAAYEGKQQLDKLSELVGKLAQAAAGATKQAGAAREGFERRVDEAERAEAAAESATAAIAAQAHALADAARDAGIDWGTGPGDAAGAVSDEQLSDEHLLLRVRGAVEQRLGDVRTVREALTAVDTSAADRARTERSVERAQERLESAKQEITLAEEQVAAARTAAHDQLSAWWQRHEAVVDGCADGVDLPGLLQDGLAQIGDPDAPVPSAVFAGAVAAGLHAARARLAVLSGRRDELRAQADAMRADRERIAAEHDDAPTTFAMREDDRAGLPGAPLWQLVRFAEGVDDVWAAGIEAALEGANLLDGWITMPEVAAATTGSHQFLLPLAPADRPDGPTLAGVLVAEEDAGVDPEYVGAVLASIALCESGADPSGSALPAIGVDGRYRQGVQTGTHHKPHAEYIGVTARARRRRLRLAELDDSIGEVGRQIENLDGQIHQEQEEVSAVEAAGQALPKVGPIVLALRRLAETAGALHSRVDADQQAREEHDRALADHGARRKQAQSLAVARRTPETGSGLESLAAAVDHFRTVGEQTVRTRRDRVAALERAVEARGRVDEARTNAEEFAVEAAQAESEHQVQADGLARLREALGADADQIDADIAATRDRIEAGKRAVREANAAKERAVELVGKAGGECAGAQESLRTAVVEAQADARELAPFARRDLLEILGVADEHRWPTGVSVWTEPDVLVSRHHSAQADPSGADAEPLQSFEVLPPAVLALHRAVERATESVKVTDSARKAIRSKLSGALGDLEVQLSAAGQDYRLEWDSPDGVMVVRVEDEHGFSPIGEFARRIADARGDQELLLTDSERCILEDALLSGLAQQIHERTAAARKLIAQMGAEMRLRHMSSGATIGVYWVLADGLDERQRTVCKLLDRESADLTAEDLSTVRAHFAARIRDERAAHPERSYPEILADVLDYRWWRVFSFSLIGPDGTEDRLTQARHSALSGGEQSVSLHLPLFAAAHVMLSSADPHSPRLLALDEAFAGVDDIGRGELLGLSVQFDLDLFMTGYDLWITYDDVPGCAHYDLAHSSVEHTVSAALLVWDGAGLLAEHDRGDLRKALGSPNRRRVPTPVSTGFSLLSVPIG